MRSRFFYAFGGLLASAGVGIIINLLSAGLQQRTFPAQFSDQSLWILAGLAILGLLIGYWLGEKLQLQSPSAQTTTPSASSSPSSSAPIDTLKPEVVTISRLRALLSYSKLKGKGIHLSDILLIGSRIDIET